MNNNSTINLNILKILNMEYQVVSHKMGDDNYHSYIEINIIFNHLKINWVLSDCGCYPSSEWIKMLNFMKGDITNNKSLSVGGGNSFWSADVTEMNFKLIFDISGCGGDSTITYEFPNDKMIPIVEQIIEKNKRNGINFFD